MRKNTIAFVLVAALGGFIGGFWLANSLNRSAGLSAPPANLPTNTGAVPQADDELSDAEINAKVAEADANPENFAFQRDLGISLYRYGAFKQRVDLLEQSTRILDRASKLKSDDFDVLVALGNGHFDIAFFRKDAAAFETARQVYRKALVLKPAEADVTTDLGITYFLQEPPDYPKAETELRKVADANPTHDRSLQFLVRVYLGQKRLEEAKATLAKLNSINSKNQAIPELGKLIAEAEAGK